MDEDKGTGRLTPAAALLMALVLLWSGGLAAGFAYAALSRTGSPSAVRSVGFLVIAFFLAVLAARTGYEIVRRLRVPRA